MYKRVSRKRVIPEDIVIKKLTIKELITNMATGMVKVYSFPDNVEIHMDGNPIRDASGNIARTPSIVSDIPPGAHQMTFKMLGYYDEIRLVDIRAGMQSNVYVTMKAIIR